MKTRLWRRLVEGQEGATMVEYALLVALLAAALVAVVRGLGTAAGSKFTSASNTISGSGGS